MAGTIFIKIDGVDGESYHAGHEGEIDCDSWSWGVTQSGSTHRGGGSGAEVGHAGDLSFTKEVDKSSANLFKYCYTGKHFPTAKMTIRKSAGESSLPYLEIKLTDFIISSVNPGGGGTGKATEAVTLNFAKVEFKYQEQDKDGNPKGGAVESWINAKENTTG